MQCERVPNDHLPECGQQNLGSECLVDWRKGSVATFGLAHDGPTEFRKRSAGPDVQRHACSGKSEEGNEPFESVCCLRVAYALYVDGSCYERSTTLRAVIAVTIVAY